MAFFTEWIPKKLAEYEAKLAKISLPEHVAAVNEAFASGAMRPTPLEEHVRKAEEEYGVNNRIAQMFRDQLAAQQRGRSAPEINLERPVE